MRIKSNIAEVMQRMRRLEAGIPAAVQRAIAPKYWKPRLQASAEKTLRALWALERNVELRAVYERAMPRILATLDAELIEGDGGARFSLRIPPIAMGGVVGQGGDVGKAIGFEFERSTPGGKESKNFRLPVEEMANQRENLERVKQGLLEWVRLEKIKDERDAGLSDEEIAERLEVIMGLRRVNDQRQYTELMQEAAKGLAAHVQAFMDTDAQGGVTRLGKGPQSMNPETALEWLTAVLTTWRAVLVASVPAKISYEVAKEMQKIKTDLL